VTAVLSPRELGALQEITATVAARAADLDECNTDVRVDLAALGEAGLLGLGLDAGLSDMVRVIDEVSEYSLAVGFSTWAQRMAIQYLHESPAPLRALHLESLVAGERIGVTAMAAGLKQVAGLGPVPVTADRHGDALLLSGPIHWASNVFEHALIVLPVRCDSDSAVVVVDVDADGVTVNDPPELMALGATASTSLRLDRVVVPAHRVVSTDLAGYVGGIRPRFLLLQTAFCTGVTRAALEAASAAHTGPTARFDDELSALGSRAGALRERLYRWADDVDGPHNVAIRNLIALRLEAAEVAVQATRLELSLTGGAAYRRGSAANRRFREAAFLPIQSPSEGQLRWELAHYG
jgi:alkylation response protein AidB-like acyl-CoA dehydrogenase